EAPGHAADVLAGQCLLGHPLGPARRRECLIDLAPLVPDERREAEEDHEPAKRVLALEPLDAVQYAGEGGVQATARKVDVAPPDRGLERSYDCPRWTRDDATQEIRSFFEAPAPPERGHRRER